MNLLNQFGLITKNLAALGQTKLIALAGAGILVLGLIVAGALYVNNPNYESLYVGLEKDDANQISLALAEANIPFRAGSDGTSITVPAGMTGKARMLLAERGLPSSNNAGYELFDHVGAMGLTSFMQEVTRVRALEGEIARTIQSISGITAARVHLVMGDQGSFRNGERKPSASVMIKAVGDVGRRSASSVRHLVASAVPGLSVDDVTILDSTGQLLASGDDYSNSALNRSVNIVQTVQSEIEDNIDKALSPFLGMENFRTSVTADLDTDAQQIQETVFDPDSRVERSVRVTRENQKSDQSSTQAPATVQQNIPNAQPQGSTQGPKSSEQNDRREEQTNYEINSKTIATTRNSYRVNKLSIAVVVNQARINAMLGDNPPQDKVDAYVKEMQQVVATAAGLDEKRGDQVKLTVMNFVDSQLDEAAAKPGLMDTLSRQVGGMVNALAFLVVAFLVVWFGLRPIARSLSAGASAAGGEAAAAAGGFELPDFSPAAVGGGTGPIDGFGSDFGSDFGFGDNDGLLTVEDSGPNGNFNRRVKEGPEKRLARMVEINEERAAKILRKWAMEEAA